MCPKPLPATAPAREIGPVPKTWVLTYLANFRSWRNLRVHAVTDSRQHMFMAWAHYKPRKKLIYKVVRGIIIQCGWVWVWKNPTILEQWDYGDTFHHTFRIDILEPADHVWYYLFTPLGPYDLQCQGPLVHVPPPETLPWATRLYVGTNSKGVYFTNNFSGPGDPQPYWLPVNDGLLGLNVWQLCGDAAYPSYQHFAITASPSGRDLYRRRPTVSPAWVPVLTKAQANTLTASTGGEIYWVCTNWHRPGFVYVLFRSPSYDTGLWCLRSADDGDTWTAFQTIPASFYPNVGNITAGVLQGTSPHPAGNVLYHSYTGHVAGHQRIVASFDNGETWAIRDEQGTSFVTPRCYADPTDHGTVYMGAADPGYWPRYLYRSTDHGLNLAIADDFQSLALLLDTFPVQMWVHPTNQNVIKLLAHEAIYQSWTYGATWEHGPGLSLPLVRLSILPWRVDYLYLARADSAPGPGDPGTGHVLYVTDDEGATLHGKSGNNAHRSDGGRDSIPFDCGGVCNDGILQLVT